MATITSVGDGYWDVAGTWDAGVPTVNDDVVIAHTVTIRDENAVCLSVTINSGKQLVFECSGGATKIAFKDDANAKIVNSGTITIQNTTAVKKCTWAGGSKTNKVDWQTEGTHNVEKAYWHWEYVKVSFDILLWGPQLFVDKDIRTNYFGIDRTGDWLVKGIVTLEPHGEDLIWTVEANKLIDLRCTAELIIKGTASYRVYIQGPDASNRMDRIHFAGIIDAKYWTHRYTVTGFWLNGGKGYLENCAIASQWNTLMGGSMWPFYFKNCVLSSGYRVFREGWYYLKFEDSDLGGTTSEMTGRTRIDLIGDGNTNLPTSWDNWQECRVAYLKRLTLTVKDHLNNPIQGAYVALIQDHAQDYKDILDFYDWGFFDAGYTDASGQITLYALHKTYRRGGNWLDETVYYSDANNNGPSGTKEKHLLKIVKPNYWPSQDKEYYMSQDRSDTIILTPYETGTRVIKFGTFQFPHVQSLPEVKKRGFVEKFIPDRNIAYRKDVGGYGRSWRISGYIDTDIWNTKAAMEALADGTARSFDRGTGEALVDCIMLDPEFPEDVDRYGRLEYTVTLMEQSNP